MILITSALECFLIEGTDQIFSSLGQHRLEFYQTTDRGQSYQRAGDLETGRPPDTRAYSKDSSFELPKHICEQNRTILWPKMFA